MEMSQALVLGWLAAFVVPSIVFGVAIAYASHRVRLAASVDRAALRESSWYPEFDDYEESERRRLNSALVRGDNRTYAVVTIVREF